MTDKPRTRTELYLAAIAGEDVIPPEPLSREEQYLYKIAMGGRPGGSGGDDAPFELIETITVSEAVKEIERTAEPDGTPYNFRKVLFKIAGPGNIGIKLFTNWSENPVAYPGLKTSVTEAETKNGRGYARYYQSKTDNYYSILYDGTGIHECDAITSLKFSATNNTSDMIPENTVIEIYAVRK